MKRRVTGSMWSDEHGAELLLEGVPVPPEPEVGIRGWGVEDVKAWLGGVLVELCTGEYERAVDALLEG